MITNKNYFTEIERIGISSLPDTLRKSDEFVVKGTNNGNSWNTYQNNEAIRKVINLYFEKLNRFMNGNRPQSKPYSVDKKKIPLNKEQPDLRAVLLG